jgi:hypothetical protein
MISKKLPTTVATHPIATRVEIRNPVHSMTADTPPNPVQAGEGHRTARLPGVCSEDRASLRGLWSRHWPLSSEAQATRDYLKESQLVCGVRAAELPQGRPPESRTMPTVL